MGSVLSKNLSATASACPLLWTCMCRPTWVDIFPSSPFLSGSKSQVRPRIDGFVQKFWLAAEGWGLGIRTRFPATNHRPQPNNPLVVEQGAPRLLRRRWRPMPVPAMLTCNGLCQAVSRGAPYILAAGRYQWQIWKVWKCFGFLIYDLVYLIILPDFLFIYDLIYLIILPK